MTWTCYIVERRSPQPVRALLAFAGICLALSGCVTPWERSVLMKDSAVDVSGIQGPTERNVRGLFKRNRQAGERTNEDGSLKPVAGTEEYLAAEELFKAKEYAQSEKAFHKIAKAKKYKKSEIREDALFMEAESAYAQGHYSKAHDKYAQLIKDYPATQHLNTIPSRLFKIAMVWLDHPQMADLSEIQQVNHEKYGYKLPAEMPTTNSKRVIFIPNFTDKGRPLFDPQGNAVAALRAIWTNDPTGPLADDALMMAASYYARTGEFQEADRHFTILREQFPDSPHVEKAFELGSHVKLMSYQGSAYDGKSLNDSEQLKLATLRLYPEMKGKDRMQAELARIKEERAERLWDTVRFYDKKGRNYRKSVATYCHMLIAEFPDSRRADDARKRLDELGPAFANGQVLLSSHPEPKQTLWQAATFEMRPSGKAGSTNPQPAWGSKFSLFRQQQSPSDPTPAMVREQRPGRSSSLARENERTDDSPPSSLPDDVENSAKPAGRARLTDRPDGADDDSAGHTRL